MKRPLIECCSLIIQALLNEILREPHPTLDSVVTRSRIQIRTPIWKALMSTEDGMLATIPYPLITTKTTYEETINP